MTKLTLFLVLTFLCCTNPLAQITNGTKSSMSTLYTYLDKAILDTVPGNQFKQYPVASVVTAHGVNFLRKDVRVLIDRPYFHSLELRLGIQTTGRKLYQELWRYPEWGVGVNRISLNSDTLFGVPKSLYAYVDLPALAYSPQRNWNLGGHVGTGISGNFQPADLSVNPTNNLIGSYFNLFINIGVWSKWKLNSRTDFRVGADLIHFSNGALKQPNRGLNMVGANVQLRYHLRNERPTPLTRDSIPRWRHRHGLYVYQAMGTKQLTANGKRYFNTTTSLGYQWWSGYRHRWVGQLDFFYDRSNNSGEDRRSIVPEADRQNASNYYSLGIFIGHEIVYNRWSFLLGNGMYLARRYPFDNVFYQRFGLRYRVWKGLAIGFALKGRTWGADYVEWSVGYSDF